MKNDIDIDDQLNIVKDRLKEDKRVNMDDNLPLYITHNEDKLFLQYCGWSIDLHANGTWCFTDTTG